MRSWNASVWQLSFLGKNGSKLEVLQPIFLTSSPRPIESFCDIHFYIYVNVSTGQIVLFSLFCCCSYYYYHRYYYYYCYSVENYVFLCQRNIPDHPMSGSLFQIEPKFWDAFCLNMGRKTLSNALLFCMSLFVENRKGEENEEGDWDSVWTFHTWCSFIIEIKQNPCTPLITHTCWEVSKLSLCCS